MFRDEDEKQCIGCGKPLSSENTNDLCGDCLHEFRVQLQYGIEARYVNWFITAKEEGRK